MLAYASGLIFLATQISIFLVVRAQDSFLNAFLSWKGQAFLILHIILYQIFLFFLLSFFAYLHKKSTKTEAANLVDLNLTGKRLPCLPLQDCQVFFWMLITALQRNTVWKLKEDISLTKISCWGNICSV